MLTLDDNYDIIKPLPRGTRQRRKKGMQCGKCGMKFDYGKAYGYTCPYMDCPTQFSSAHR